MRVSHETIYRSLFIQARGVLEKELIQQLRSKRSIRRSVHARASGQSRGQIVDDISIQRKALQRLKIVPSLVIGREICLSGTGNSHIATLVERHSRFTILVKVPSKDTATVVRCADPAGSKTPRVSEALVDQWDRGLEMAKQQQLHRGHEGECLLL